MSNTVPKILKELHRIRRHLRELQQEIDLGPRLMKSQQDKLAAEERVNKEAHDTIKRLKLRLKEDEISLKSTEQQLAKFQAELNTAGSKKEFDLKQSEIANATTKKGQYEDVILATITEIEDRTAGLTEVENRWKLAQSEFAQYQVDAKERLDRLLADQVANQALLTETEKQIPGEIRPLYDRLVKKFHADALAGVAGRTCQQCRTSITEQQRINLQRGEFLCCPQCARALYLAEG